MAWDDHSSKGHAPLKDKPGKNNWVENNSVRDRLPDYIERIARHLVADQGYTESRAIATAVNTVRLWATGKNHPAGSEVSPETQAKAAAAYAQWKAMAASAKSSAGASSGGKSKKKGKKVRNLVRDLFTWLQEPIGSRPVELASKPKKDGKTEWAHGFIPKTPTAARIKDHRQKGSASDAPTPVKGSDDYNHLSAKQRREVDSATAEKPKTDEQATTKASKPDSQDATDRIPPAVWRGRAQRLAALSDAAMKRSLAGKSDVELQSLRRVIPSINDNAASKTGPDAGRSFAGLVAAIDAEVKARKAQASK